MARAYGSKLKVRPVGSNHIITSDFSPLKAQQEGSKLKGRPIGSNHIIAVDFSPLKKVP
jgi:hypothetical protein